MIFQGVYIQKQRFNQIAMSSQDYFQVYIETIAETFRRVKKIGFKKLHLVKDLIETAERFLEKQVYGRIEPANYLLVLIVLLGSKTSKLYAPIISAVQRMFSYNFISPHEDLWGSLKLLKEEHKEFLLLPSQDYNNKSFKEIYIETLMNLGEKDQGLNLNVAKSVSLIWRLDENSIPFQLLPKIFDYLLDCMAVVRLQDEQKMLKSVFLEMFRHSLESYRQAHDRKFLYEDNCISLKNVVHKYGEVLADKVAIQLDVAARSGITNYPIIPPENSLQAFQLLRSHERNEKGIEAGKFGWCTNCRQTANFYCTVNRLPVCCYQCKMAVFNQIQSLQKFMIEEQRSLEVFEGHIVEMFKLFSKYLLQSDPRKRVVFSEIFVLMASQLKKIVDKLTPKTYKELKGVVRQVLVNIYAESDAFLPCMATLKKLLHLRIFIDQTEILLKLFARKLTYYLTGNHIREEILKFIKDLVGNRFLFDSAMVLDCSSEHYDAVREVVDAMRQLYIGIKLPENINIPPAEDANARRMSLQICLTILKFLQQTDKKMPRAQAQKLVIEKNKLNMIRNNIQKFNASEKPLKITKKLIDQGFFPRDPERLAAFLHENLKNLSLTNVGQLIGDIDEFAGQIRKHYIGQMNFHRLPLDEAMRVMLKNFTLPGESQVVERIIDTFGVTYFQQNKEDTPYANSDAVYSFSYLLMMLQSNLHNPQVIEKMTLLQFSKLSKGMNGSPDAEFAPDFLETVYNSIQKKPLGVHEKLKEIQIIIAYNTNPKKAQEIYLKDLQRQAIESLSILQEGPLQQLHHAAHYPLAIFVQEFVCQIIDMLCFKIKDLQEKDKDEIVKSLELVEAAVKLGNQWLVPKVVQRGIQKIWEEIQKSGAIKKYMLMEAMFQWVRKYSEHINQQWKVVIYLIGRFNRSKTIRKDQNTGRRNVAITIMQNKCFLLQSYIDHLMNRTQKFHIDNLISFLRALLGVSREETNQTGSSFCLQKINEVIEHNASRSLEILTIFWNDLRDYYIELGRHKNERVALFASDFLKQIVTKFLKRKDLLPLQKEYLKPFQEIFLSTKSFAVKELMIGGMSYFVSNHHVCLKNGWKVILSVVSNCFEEQEDAVIKDKAYVILKKIYQSNFTIINLEEFYNDIIQILNKLTREKEENYALGCLQIIQLIVDFYHNQLGINLEKSLDSQENSRIDINFWQTIFLPLLNIIFPMCGDSRTKIQSPAIKTLFEFLMKYGKLFRYEFWKMVLQGVLRPAFEEITYTSQSKPLKKDQLEKWLNYSFSELFRSINELIVLYYNDFRLFLEDVFKIYENCILNHSLIILIDLSLKALNQLLEKIAPNFEQHDWEVYIFFVQSLLKKTLPIELSSIESWNRSKDLLENNHQAKCFALQTFLNKMQIIFQKYPQSITQQIYLNVLKQLDPIYQFIVDFNENLQLREALWKNGFYQEQKFLPGLIRQQYQILAFRSKIYFKLIDFDPAYIKQYFKHFFTVVQALKASMLHEIIKAPSVKDYERQRFSMYYRKLTNEILLGQIVALGSQTIVKAQMSERLLQQCMNLMGNRLYCTRCSFCEGCENSAEVWLAINRQLQSIVMMLFKGK